ncbi:MAG: hypothetical protein KME42_27880 [Tildeniella nuda ZEHNDER 1965/U140]|nr:hypothetical protein [Tildeniella nuda ZEHNDER 1965/U140]
MLIGVELVNYYSTGVDAIAQRGKIVPLHCHCRRVDLDSIAIDLKGSVIDLKGSVIDLECMPLHYQGDCIDLKLIVIDHNCITLHCHCDHIDRALLNAHSHHSPNYSFCKR